MRIAISTDNNKVVKILPITPTDIQLDYPIITEEMDSIKYGTVLIVKKEGLATVDISSVFPTKKYPFIQPGATSDGWGYVRWFRDQRKKRKLMRVVITNKSGKEYFNRLCFCEKFSVSGVDQNGDISYSISFKQYRRT